MIPAAGEQRLARAALTYLAEPADPAAGFLLSACEPAEVLAAIKAGRIPAETRARATPAQAAAIAQAIACWHARSAQVPSPAELAAHDKAGIRLICPGDPDWPPQLDVLGGTRPYALWLRGSASLPGVCVRSVSITGSRAATAYGQHVSAAIAAGLAGSGWTVISGGAYGIDAAAHRAALAAGGATITVLASGADQPYPRGNHDLFEAITARGLLVSEWPPGTAPTRTRFARRGRVIAALGGGSVVVEAGPRSGAIDTAKYARQVSRHLMAVPGPVNLRRLSRLPPADPRMRRRLRHQRCRRNRPDHGPRRRPLRQAGLVTGPPAQT